MSPARLTLALMLVAAFALSACGAGSSGGSGEKRSASTAGHASGPGGASGSAGAAGSRPVSPVGRAPRPTFVRNADRVCRDAHARLARLSHQMSGLFTATARRQVSVPQYYRRASALTRESAREVTRAVENLRALPRPRNSGLERYLSLSAVQARLLAGEADALQRRDLDAMRRLKQQIHEIVVQSRAFAHSYGFHACGGG